jgi:hypothetical protein
LATSKEKSGSTIHIEDEPGMAERFQRGLQRAFTMPHKPHPTLKPKERPASKGRVHTDKTKD